MRRSWTLRAFYNNYNDGRWKSVDWPHKIYKTRLIDSKPGTGPYYEVMVNPVCKFPANCVRLNRLFSPRVVLPFGHIVMRKGFVSRVLQFIFTTFGQITSHASKCCRRYLRPITICEKISKYLPINYTELLVVDIEFLTTRTYTKYMMNNNIENSINLVCAEFRVDRTKFAVFTAVVILTMWCYYTPANVICVVRSRRIPTSAECGVSYFNLNNTIYWTARGGNGFRQKQTKLSSDIIC